MHILRYGAIAREYHDETRTLKIIYKSEWKRNVE